MGTLGLTASTSYAKENGQPVAAIWGVGFKERLADPDDALAAVRALHDDRIRRSIRHQHPTHLRLVGPVPRHQPSSEGAISVC